MFAQIAQHATVANLAVGCAPHAKQVSVVHPFPRSYPFEIGGRLVERGPFLRRWLLIFHYDPIFMTHLPQAVPSRVVWMAASPTNPALWQLSSFESWCRGCVNTRRSG